MNNDKFRRVLDGTFWAYVQNWLARGIAIIALLVLGRMLRPEDFGVFALVMVVLTMAEPFVDQALAQALVQRPDLDDHHRSSAFWLSLLIGLCFFIVALAIAVPVASAFGHPEVAPVLLAVSPVFLLMALASVPAAMLRRELQFKVLAKRAVLANVLSALVAIALAAAGLGVWAFVGQMLTYHLVGLVVLWRHETWRPSWAFSWLHLRQLAGFSGQVLIVRILDFVESKVVDLIVGRFLGLVALGQYSLATRANQAVTQVMSAPLWEASLSAFARLQPDTRSVQTAYRRMSGLAVLVATPVFFVAAGVAEQAVPGLFGVKWRDSIPAFQVLAIVGGLRAFAMLNNCLLEALGQVRFSVLLASIRSTATLVAVVFLFRFGITGVALAFLVGQLVVTPISFVFVRRQCDVSLAGIGLELAKAAAVGSSALAVSAELGTLMATRVDAIVAAAIGGAGGLICFVCLGFALSPGTLRAQLGTFRKNAKPRVVLPSRALSGAPGNDGQARPATPEESTV